MRTRKTKRWKNLPETSVKQCFMQEIDNQVTAINLSLLNNVEVIDVYAGIMTMLTPLYNDTMYIFDELRPIVTKCLREYGMRHNFNDGDFAYIYPNEVYNIAIKKKLIIYK